MSKHTSRVLMVAIKEELQVILSKAGPSAADLVFTDGLDSNENPTLLITQDASPATTEANCLIRLAPFVDDIARTDALGLAQRVYAPHVCDILAQKTASTDTPANTPVDTAGITASALLARIVSTTIAQVSRKGVKARLLDQANGTDAAVAVSQLATAVLRFELGDILFKRSGEV